MIVLVYHKIEKWSKKGNEEIGDKGFYGESFYLILVAKVLQPPGTMRASKSSPW